MTDDTLRAALDRLPKATCYRTHTQPDEHRGVFGAVWLADVKRALAASAPDEGARCNCGVPGPHRLTCPVSIEAGKRIAALNQRADDIRIGYAAASAPDDHD